MKTIVIVVFAIGLGTINAQCLGSLNTKKINNEITLEDGRQFLLGKINSDRLKTEPYAAWYLNSYSGYTVDKTLVNRFSKKLKNTQIKLFLGTWCGDSKREVPRFLKILEEADYPIENLEIVALDRREGRVKTSPGGEEKGLNIVKVPTFIFFEDGKEINRIIESPIETLEEDIATIVSKANYVPNYAHLKRTK